MISRWNSLLFILILTVIAIFSIYYAMSASLWRDEIYSLNVAHAGVDDLVDSVLSDVHPPLYYVAIAFVSDIFGYSWVKLRLFSVLQFVLALSLSYFVMCRFMRRTFALSATLAIALNPFFFDRVLQIRMYGLLWLFLAASTYFFVSVLEEEQNNKAKSVAVAFVVFCLFASYSHNYGILFIFSFFVVKFIVIVIYLVEKARRAREILLSWMTMGIVFSALYAPGLYLAARGFSKIEGDFWIDREPMWQYMGGLIAIFSGTLYSFVPYVLAPLYTFLIAVAVYAHVSLYSRDWKTMLRHPLTMIAVACFLPVLVTAVMSEIIQPIFLPRGLIWAGVVFIMVAFRGLDRIYSHGRKAVAVATTVGILILGFVSFLDFVLNHQRPNYLAGLAWLSQNIASDDIVAVSSMPSGPALRMLMRNEGIDREPLRVGDRLPESRLVGARLWIVGRMFNGVWPRTLVERDLHSIVSLGRVDGVEIYCVTGHDAVQVRCPREL